MVDEHLKRAQAEKAYYDQAINQAATTTNLGGAILADYQPCEAQPSMIVRLERIEHAIKEIARVTGIKLKF